MVDVVISGTGLSHPPHAITNEELVGPLRVSVDAFNSANQAQIEAGQIKPRAYPDPAFIEKASGIKSRYVMNKEGILDPERLGPIFENRTEDQLSIQSELAVAAIEQALASSGYQGSDIDAIICGSSNLQRPYPAMAVEIQQAIGADGWAFDMNVACSSATFSIQQAVGAVQTGAAKRVVVVNPEITSGHNNFALRDYHFIFGDAATAVVVEAADTAQSDAQFWVRGTKLVTKFSNNIRNDGGFMNQWESPAREPMEMVFRQNGNQVFREVCPMVTKHILAHLSEFGTDPHDVKRFWLHQANIKMNNLICKGVLGRPAQEGEAPTVIDEFANTSSAGSVIAFHRYHRDMAAGDLGVLCSFGAGYSIGSVLLERR